MNVLFETHLVENNNEFDPNEWEEIEEELDSDLIYNLPIELKYKILSYLSASMLFELKLDNKMYWEIERIKKPFLSWNFKFDWSLVNFPRHIKINKQLHAYNLIGDKLHRCLSRHLKNFSGLLIVNDYCPIKQCFEIELESMTKIQFFPNNRPLIKGVPSLVDHPKAQRFYRTYKMLTDQKYSYPPVHIKTDLSIVDWNLTRWLPPYYDFEDCTDQCVYNTTKIYETDSFLMITTEPINIEHDDLEFDYKFQSSPKLTTWKIFRNKFLIGIAILCDVSTYKEFPLKYYTPKNTKFYKKYLEVEKLEELICESV
ncbi:hypothetical protein KM759_gp098 [Lymphocystis disease virus 4]|uniref:F-box domain-containing protein n=1 Tax=Lymphocystis disease virus 4 TaxID=2704413 RepID=A0A6B9XMH5_9VIRU|nr:hypothetical protein KM759_gp098 [Lymphocystis disease virus 4]QHR78483.1 hypothetical protein [Lymphocystis disease virus 4]